MNSKHKIVHVITNHVTKQFVADAITVYGASPIMSETPEEFDDIYPHIKSLVVNLGMLDEQRKQIILSACLHAKELNLPIVIDLVGIHFSPYRRAFALNLIEAVSPKVLKGNYDEVLCLYTKERYSTFESTSSMVSDYLKELSFNHPKVTFLATGSIDYICGNGDLITSSGGSACLSKLSGTGCVLAGLLGAELASAPLEDRLTDLVYRVSNAYKEASSRAEDSSKGRIGQFKIDLISEIEVMI